LWLRNDKNTKEKGTSRVKRNLTRPTLSVTADGRGVAAHAGTRLLAEMADATGLTSALSEAMAPTVERRRRHDPGRVLLDLALTVADGGTSLSDLAVLRDQPALFGPVASTPTASRVVDDVGAERLEAIRTARSSARAAAWKAGLNPISSHGPLILDFDATLLDAASEKERAERTYKKGFGFFPLLCFLDATNEALAGILRPGNAGANTAADHIEVLDLALAQLPVVPDGPSHGFIDELRERGIEFSVGFPITEEVRTAIQKLPKKAWSEAIKADCSEREGAQVAELTGLDLKTWPIGTRAIVRREEPHPGAQFNLFDRDGWRHQIFICDSADPDISYREARHRGHARVEDRIRCAKDTGLRRLPFAVFENNACWMEIVLMAQDLLAFTQGLVLTDDLAKAEPKRLRYTVLHTAGRLTTSGRVTTLRMQCEWPWAKRLAEAFTLLRSLSFVT
jgi:hypothetical protein